MATTTKAQPHQRKLPRQGRGGVISDTLTSEEARIKAIAEIVSQMVDLSLERKTVELNQIKTATCRKYGLARGPKLVEMIDTVPNSDNGALLLKLRGKPVRTKGVAR